MQHQRPERISTAHATPHIPAALQNFDALPDSANVRLLVVAALLGVSTATVWRMARRGDLPRPRKLTDRITAWNVGELRQRLSKEAV